MGGPVRRSACAPQSGMRRTCRGLPGLVLGLALLGHWTSAVELGVLPVQLKTGTFDAFLQSLDPSVGVLCEFYAAWCALADSCSSTPQAPASDTADPPGVLTASTFSPRTTRLLTSSTESLCHSHRWP